jgi:hypothetical protein
MFTGKTILCMTGSDQRAIADDLFATPVTMPSERLLTHFTPLMSAAGYLYRKTGHRFQRSSPMGSYEFSPQF